jgi:putative aminopeptidase FrvX
MKTSVWTLILWASWALLALSRPSQVSEDEALWQALVETPAPSGLERDLADRVRTALTGIPLESDNLGNLWVTFGTGDETWVVLAHLDEPAWTVGEARPDGFLRMTPVALSHTPARLHGFIIGHPVWVGPPWTNGVVALPSTHLQRGTGERSRHYNDLGPNDLYVDVGAASAAELEQADLGPLSRVVPQRAMVRLHGDRRAGWHVADRAFVEVLVRLAHALHRNPPSGRRVTVAWVTQELYGARGRLRLATRFPARRVVRLDVVAPFSQDGTWVEPDVAPGQGVLVGTGERFGYAEALARFVLDVARRVGVPARSVPAPPPPPATYPPARTRWDDAEAVLMSLPTLYPHTAVETVSATDRRHLLRLLYALLVGPDAPLTETRLPTVAASPTRPGDRHPAEALLRTLTETYGVSGHEGPVADEIRKRLPPWARPQTDGMGNLWITFGPAQGPHWVFVAHMDEIGYRIRQVLPDGTATVEKVGGFYDEIYEAQPVVVVRPDGTLVPGIIRPRDGYWREDRARADYTEADVRVEFGTATAEETRRLGVEPGLSLTFVKRYRPLLGLRANARSFDDRVGCVALLLALQDLRPTNLKKRVTFLWSVQEEVGLRGAIAFAESHPADVVVAVDTFVSADSPVEPYPYGRARLGAGAVLRAIDSSNLAPADLVRSVQAAARRRGWPLQWGITRGGNDGAAFVPYGALDFPIGWALRYSHSQAEVIDLRDVESLARWVTFLVETPP